MIGRQIQNYRIERLLGQGGMGSVYLATDMLLDRPVAVKMLLPSLVSQPTFLDRFKTEAQVLARLNHPNIAMLYTYIREGTDYFMIMEYLEGQTLDGWLQRHGPVPPVLAVQIVIQALAGLQHAHTRGILHRDLKPANLMVTPEGVVKLMDFGIARIVGSRRVTQVNRTVGTLEYMAPEQLQGLEPQLQSDIYALGVVLYELLTGKVPHTGNTDYEIMERVLKQDCIPLRKCVQNLPAGLDETLAKAMRKKPEQRFAAAQTFLQALQTTVPYTMRLDEQGIDQYLRLQPKAIATRLVSNLAKDRTRLSSVPKQGQGSFRLPENGRYLLSQVGTLARNVGDYTPSSEWLAKNRRSAGVSVAALLLLGIGFSLWPPDVTKSDAGIIPDSVKTVGNVPESRKEQPNPVPAGNETSLLSTDLSEVDEPVQSPNPDQPSVGGPVPSLSAPVKRIRNLPGTTPAQPTKAQTSARKESVPQRVNPSLPVTSSAVAIVTTPVKSAPVPDKVLVAPPAPEKPEPIGMPASSGRRSHRLSGGTEIVVVLEETIAAATAREGQLVNLQVAKSVAIDGDVVIPAGATVKGEITGVDTGGKKEMLELRVRSIQSADGQSIPLRGGVFKYVGSKGKAVTYKSGQQFMVYTAQSLTF